MNKAAVTGDGVEPLQGNAWKGKVTNEDLADGLSDIADAESARCRAIASLPVLNVDPDLTAYAADLVQSRTEVASSTNVAVGFALQLLQHRNDQEGIFWNALLDQAAQTGNDFKSIRPQFRELQARTTAVAERCMGLKAREMRVRSTHSQRFNREFPAMASYVAPERSQTKANPLSRDRIKQDVIGWSIGDWPNTWSFDSPQEFISFRITGYTNRNEISADYDVATQVRDSLSGAEHDFRLHLTHAKWLTRWKLAKVQELQRP